MGGFLTDTISHLFETSPNKVDWKRVEFEACTPAAASCPNLLPAWHAYARGHQAGPVHFSWLDACCHSSIEPA